MLRTIPLPLQSLYSELLDRVTTAAFADAFPEPGSFVWKDVDGRRYWYFQALSDAGKKQRYVGPETPELADRIARHRGHRQDLKERRALVSTLIRSAHLPRPLPQLGAVVAALAEAGVFRLRSVLVGTMAYQTYPAMLGVRISAAAVQTDDVDIAQFREVSVAVDDSIPPILSVLKAVDKSFREVPGLHGPQSATCFRAQGGIRVDFLTPNRGPDTDVPQRLPALQTAAQPLRFLDFLIRDPEPAIVLHGSGVHVHVPAPQRYALHKLIVARRRQAGSAKQNKDLYQAESLLDALVDLRSRELGEAWNEAFSRGSRWRQLIGEGIAGIKAEIRDRTLKTVGALRSTVHGLDLAFDAPTARYESDRQVVAFTAKAGGETVRCAVSREALEDHFGAGDAGRSHLLQKFVDSREFIQRLCRQKYLYSPIEEPGTVLLKSEEVPKLRKVSGKAE
jgi:hypothetical protein